MNNPVLAAAIEIVIERLRQENTQLRTILRQTAENMFVRGYCDFCTAILDNGEPHSPDCALAALLNDD